MSTPGPMLELERVETQEYWEVSDRGINFEWLPPDRRATLETFFGWFGPMKSVAPKP